ncbi:hypothetical protein F2Q69_00041905 [Brassica cretica]|uniref:Uncharacterized protein n=1 Tax=Brassica cretica TaxID=69181 RepID=A0A8S9NME5_BRACR|nr:hypothetical protein F2Q69_00041905 [Brassica cretica]
MTTTTTRGCSRRGERGEKEARRREREGRDAAKRERREMARAFGLIPVDLDAWKLRRRAKSHDSLHYLEAMVKIFSACSEKIILTLTRIREHPSTFYFLYYNLEVFSSQMDRSEAMVKFQCSGVLAEILQQIMGKGLIPVDLDVWKLRRRAKSHGSLHYLEAMIKIFSACSEKIILKSEKLLRE